MNTLDELELNEAYDDITEVLDRQGHDSDCAFRCVPPFGTACLRNHSCKVCDAE